MIHEHKKETYRPKCAGEHGRGPHEILRKYQKSSGNSKEIQDIHRKSYGHLNETHRNPNDISEIFRTS